MALTVKIRADASHFKKTIAGIEVQASGLTGVMGKLGSSIPVMGAALTAAAVAASALGASLAFIKSASGAAAGMESLAMNFEVLTGSAKKSKELIKQFRDEAVKSPLNVNDYADAARSFMSYGVSAEKVLPLLKMVGDVSLGNSERFGLLNYAMAQIASNKLLKGDDLRQLVAQGFNPLAEIAKKTGRAYGDLLDDMSNHLITFEMVEGALKDVTSEGGRFFGAIEKGASTTEGKIAKFGDAIFGLKVAFGTGFNEGLKSALDASNAFLPQLESNFANAGTRLGVALRKSAQGNHSAFVEIGIFIGESLALGFQDVAGNIIVDSLRSAMMATAGSQKHEQEKMRGLTDKMFGPKVGIQERAMDLADTIKSRAGPVLAATEQDSWKIVLRRQIEQTDRQIALQKEANTKLEKIANGSPKPLTSR
jgi:hypothetical protein